MSDEENWVEIPRNEYADLVNKVDSLTRERDNLLLIIDKLRAKLDTAQSRLDMIEGDKEGKKWK
jgi:predicted nuclease with TOPRIM domain